MDTANKTLTVPESVNDADIKKLFEYGTVSDADGNANLKTVSLSGDKVTLTLQGKNGKTGDIDTTTQIWTVKRMAITAEFPDEITTGNSIVAGDSDFFKTLFAKEFALSDGSKTKPSKVLVNGEEVTKEHIINVPKTYTLQLLIRKNSKDISKEYTLTVDSLKVVEHNISVYQHVEQPVSAIGGGTNFIENTLKHMQVGEMMAFLKSGIFKSNPNIKPVVVLEQSEQGKDSNGEIVEHEFLSRSKTLTDNIS